MNPLDLSEALANGRWHRPLEDTGRLQAYLPSAGSGNHAATLVTAPNGNLLCAWMGGEGEGTTGMNIVLSHSAPHAESWTTPTVISSDPTRSEQNPALFLAPDNALHLYYTAQETRGCTLEEWKAQKTEGGFMMQWTAETRRRISTDNGFTWGDAESLFETPGSFMRSPPITLANGQWLLPTYMSLEAGGGFGNDHSVMRLTADGGRTWSDHPVPDSQGRVHASVVELASGHVKAFFRSRYADWIYASESHDSGKTWTPPKATPLPNNNSSIQVIRLTDGRVACIFNLHQGNTEFGQVTWPSQRHPLSLALSEDGGETWNWIRDLDTGDGFITEEHQEQNRRLAYPALHQMPDGQLAIAYSWGSRASMKVILIERSSLEIR